MASSIVHPLNSGSYSIGGGAATVYRSPSNWCTDVPPEIAATRPTVGLWVPGTYASLWDLQLISIPDDSINDFTDAVLQRWLQIGAARINEHLGQRGWPVPLTAWSESVVWANCELAYIGAARKRGLNTEANSSDFRAREDAVNSWCASARDREITPDPRPSDNGLPTQAIGYKGPVNRGWDRVYYKGSSRWRS